MNTVMEFRDFCRIFIERRTLFFGTVGVVVLFSLFAYRLQPERYETSLLLNVARTGSRETAEYTYDQFYRLQADERFADTVVRWLEEPSVREEIASRSETSADVVGTISAKRLSSQIISVRYRARSVDGFGGMAHAVLETLNGESARLNELSRDADWFTLVADKPVVRDVRFPLATTLSVGFVGGIFVAFWTVLSVWYFRGPVGVEKKKGKR